MSDFDETVRDILSDQEPHACCCMGPQDGEPVCPCAMKYVKIVDGHYIQISDLGKVNYSKFNHPKEYNVVLTGYTDSITLMKKIRKLHPSVTIKKVGEIMNDLPWTLNQGLSLDDAAELKFELEEAGGVVELE